GNGAGKSTLLSILAGIVRPDSGRVTGVEQRHIGYMPDSLQIPAGVSARRWLMYMAQLRGTKRNRIEEVLDMVGLTDAAGRELSSYSRGMMQRLLFAQMILD
ncbi:ATP-binding cassette domain-containing protein, partial [Klebsiella pneumoniae]|nr:ATP-binding cassette domain-containing protein [Klebsiella pneumoniae]